MIYSRLLLLVYGVTFPQMYQASKLDKKRKAEYKLASNTVICGQLTSPVDILLYVRFFSPKRVVFPSN